jgi:uncharacterized protein YjiS (DUF1127 family)
MSIMENIMQSKTALAAGPVGNLSGSFPSAQTQISSLAKLVSAIRSKLAEIDSRQREREAIEFLNQLDDHILSDIGIPRWEIEAVVRNGRRGASTF